MSASNQDETAWSPIVVTQKTNRVSVALKADIRAGVTNGLTTKVEDLERYLAES